MREEADYEGIRISFVARLGNIRIPIQIDIGFGDVVTPAPIEVEYPTLLNLPAPMLAAYPRETVVAEKFEAMVKLGMANSRMKDFHDINTLAGLFEFDGAILTHAIAATFSRRKTPVPVATPVALTAEFYEEVPKCRQWTAFIERNRLYVEALQLPEVVTVIAAFLLPVLRSLANEQAFTKRWSRGGPWVDL